MGLITRAKAAGTRAIHDLETEAGAARGTIRSEACEAVASILKEDVRPKQWQDAGEGAVTCYVEGVLLHYRAEDKQLSVIKRSDGVSYPLTSVADLGIWIRLFGQDDIVNDDV